MLAALLMTAAPDFSALRPERVVTGLRFTEGAVWKGGELIFSDIPANRLYVVRKGRAEIYREPSENANGNNLDRQGRLLTAHHGSRAVTRTEKDGKVTVLAREWEGKRLNSPNDVVEAKSGVVYFTDPPYGISREQEELGFSGVWRVRPGEAPEPLVRDFRKPNGLAFSPDGKRLYVDDTEARHVRVFDVQADGTLANGRVFVDVKAPEPNNPDGLRVDRQGNLYVTAGPSVQVYAPDGKPLGAIPLPEVATNCAFGERDRKTLFITAGGSVYRVRVPIAGL